MRATLPLVAVIALIALINAPASEAGKTKVSINIDINIAMMLNAVSQPEDSPVNMMSLFSMLPPQVQEKLEKLPFLKALLKLQIKQMKQDLKKVG